MDKNEQHDEDERDEDERKRDKDKDVMAGTVGQLPLPPVDDRRPPRRDRDRPPEVVQDYLEPTQVKPGRRAFRTDVSFDNEKRGVYEVVDWSTASIDNKVRSVRLKPIEGTKGRTEWVSAMFVRMEGSN